MPIDLTPVPTPSLTSIYGDFTSLKAEVGVDNVDLLADIDSDENPTTILNSQQYAMTVADTIITTELSNNNYTTPTSQNLPMLKLIWAKLAAFQLYQLKGVDSNKDNYFTDKRDWAMTQLSNLTFGNRGGFATSSSAVPSVVRLRG